MKLWQQNIYFESYIKDFDSKYVQPTLTTHANWWTITQEKLRQIHFMLGKRLSCFVSITIACRNSFLAHEIFDIGLNWIQCILPSGFINTIGYCIEEILFREKWNGGAQANLYCWLHGLVAIYWPHPTKCFHWPPPSFCRRKKPFHIKYFKSDTQPGKNLPFFLPCSLLPSFLSKKIQE